ncbi:hypothetical protein KBY24_13890 [Ruegeria pomeroyi]|uniref:Uncharacterized protein n=1 Tax=Ruegeria alba TaxID=2916756 RepID=A0ABS9NXW4_9RHOB|nr:hypothetical protein [Ruegeria alba]MCE8512940.1 hypothetical protein [Ruegeria pomeroyi]MCE8521859.1 hypothetical protein [Ruegeria pomeroyi]MCE8526325.1 hypothetical protein [Ruegeria pomeroyi]MCE8529596.1 hypothetical protein [Ruegeria pomeroyi]MCE8534479.1 hypothetical protein [Ruegeria pomeroyi]
MAQTRFVKSVVANAEKIEVQMPWARGVRRAAMIARRNTAQRKLKSA